MQTRTRQRAATGFAMQPFFANDDLLSLVIVEALPAAALHAVCKQWRRLADTDRVWRSKCLEHFPATADLVGVTSYKHLFARLSGHSMPVVSKLVLPPQLGDYQFLVRLTAGDEVLLNACLSGHDASSQPAFPWTTSSEHRRVFWPVKLPDAAVQGLADAIGADSMGSLVEMHPLATMVGKVLDAAAGREPDEAPLHVNVTTFRAADQRCELLMTAGCREDSPPSDRIVGFQALELGDGFSFSELSPLLGSRNAGRSLDAFGLYERGIAIVDSSGSEWFVPEDDDFDVDCYTPSLGFQVTLLPHLGSSGSVEWELELDLECDGPATGEDGLWSGSYLGGSVQHHIFLRGLNEEAIV